MKLEVSDVYKVASHRWSRDHIKEMYALAAALIVGSILLVTGLTVASTGETTVWTCGSIVLVALGGVVLTGALVCAVFYGEKLISYKREFVQKWVDEEKTRAIEAVTTSQLQELVAKTLALSPPSKKRQVSKK